MDKAFFPDRELALETVEAGKVTRKIRARGGRMMMVEVLFAPGAIGADHEHPHEQATYCLEGKFEFRHGTERRTLGVGDTVYVAGGVRHGVTCLEKGRLLDVFTPQREDFLKK